MSIIFRKISNTLIILMLSVISCVSNYEPAILEIIASSNTVKKGGLISLQCIARDEDESSIRYLDSLKYNWSASGGLFLEPYNLDTLHDIQNFIIALDSINQISFGSKIYWLAADSLGFGIDTGFQTITCQVVDLNNAIDIFSILIRVQ
mgnify:CR=1 FL=1